MAAMLQQHLSLKLLLPSPSVPSPTLLQPSFLRSPLPRLHSNPLAPSHRSPSRFHTFDSSSPLQFSTQPDPPEHPPTTGNDHSSSQLPVDSSISPSTTTSSSQVDAFSQDKAFGTTDDYPLYSRVPETPRFRKTKAYHLPRTKAYPRVKAYRARMRNDFNDFGSNEPPPPPRSPEDSSLSPSSLSPVDSSLSPSSQDDAFRQDKAFSTTEAYTVPRMKAYQVPSTTPRMRNDFGSNDFGSNEPPSRSPEDSSFSPGDSSISPSRQDDAFSQDKAFSNTDDYPIYRKMKAYQVPSTTPRMKAYPVPRVKAYQVPSTAPWIRNDFGSDEPPSRSPEDSSLSPSSSPGDSSLSPSSLFPGDSPLSPISQGDAFSTTDDYPMYPETPRFRKMKAYQVPSTTPRRKKKRPDMAVQGGRLDNSPAVTKLTGALSKYLSVEPPRRERYLSSEERRAAVESILTSGSLLSSLDGVRFKLEPSDFNNILRGFGEQKKWQEAGLVFDWMKVNKKLIPASVTSFISMMSEAGFPDKALRTYKSITDSDLRRNKSVCNALFKTLIDSGNVESAFTLFEELKSDGFTPDLFTYSMLMAGCAKHQSAYTKAESLLEELAVRGLKPDSLIYASLLQVCTSFGLEDEAKAAFEKMKSDKIPPNISHYSSLLNMYAEKGKPDEAEKVFKDMEEARLPLNGIIYNSLMKAYSNGGQLEKARKLLHEMESLGFPVEDPLSNVVVATL